MFLIYFENTLRRARKAKHISRFAFGKEKRRMHDKSAFVKTIRSAHIFTIDVSHVMPYGKHCFQCQLISPRSKVYFCYTAVTQHFVFPHVMEASCFILSGPCTVIYFLFQVLQYFDEHVLSVYFDSPRGSQRY